MIDSIEGKIVVIADQHVVIRPSSSGFSLLVSVPNSTLFKKDDAIELKIYMHWSQEQGPHLFGFLTEKERQVFLLIISCSGIGPKIGLAALNHLSPNAFIAALLQGDIKTLSKISGIGTRKAETLIVSLKNKASELVKDGFELGVDGALATTITETSRALESLGYTHQEISPALSYLTQQELPPETTVTLLLKKALAFLAQNRSR
ncbi:MAG: Holliday junction ATP-dependent DNA helicase RuvA [candidate division TM6 bacterium GW2011_GWE2_42_60]|nr:MAG: Holliday junction ATP-dependent DNA helicase RuvA [candidate division TM6 bacterium GW2011_GWE2_42_60]HBY05330.1 Holliday junction branch migration protein RuvA [Candidatus Dependentiae bacterium]